MKFLEKYNYINLIIVILAIAAITLLFGLYAQRQFSKIENNKKIVKVSHDHSDESSCCNACAKNLPCEGKIKDIHD